jgi:hypothetical protein
LCLINFFISFQIILFLLAHQKKKRKEFTNFHKMACATLKRSLDWESLNQRPTKRARRCHYGSPSTSSHQNNENVKLIEPVQSPFTEAASNSLTKLTPEKMAQNIHEEIKRLHRRKQLTYGAMERDSDSGSGSDSPRRPDTPPDIVKNPDQALFTFKQVKMICERMIKEREESLREEYDAVLNNKLAEQYDAFVKFTYDQIQSRYSYQAAPSYLS